MTTPLATSGRVRFSQGRAELAPKARTPAGMVRAEASVVSPGTERRHLAQTTHGPGRDAGYMNLARTSHRQWVLAPCPHGSAFNPEVPGAVAADGALPAYLIALARFQLMAARGLDRAPVLDLEEVLVVGSGLVATGCVLELRRRGANRIRVDPPHRHPAAVSASRPGLHHPTRPRAGGAGRGYHR